MSRRKQLNPKSIKDAIENKINSASVNAQILNNSESISQNLEKNKCPLRLNKNEENIKNEPEAKGFRKTEQIEIIDGTRSSNSSPITLVKQYENEKIEFENDIDIETFSETDEIDRNTEENKYDYISNDENTFDKEYNDIDNTSSNVKENNNNSNKWSFNLSSPQCSNSSTNYASRQTTTDETVRSNVKTDIKLKRKNSKLEEDEDEINKKSLHIIKINQQRSNPILVNGKKYYPLLFNCPDCGVRYSDKGALTTHQQNYCSKRNNNSNSNSNSNSNLIEFNFQIKETIDDSNKKSTPKSKSVFNVHCLPSDEKNVLCEKSDTNLQKKEIYQCSCCTFTTDKKFIINKHSRVHLAQKRKAMEELNNSIKEDLNDGVSTALIKQNDKKQNHEKKTDSQVSPTPQKLHEITETCQAYCDECEIKFSSMKTFMHHKTHYCQKFKTIEVAQNVTQQDSYNSKVLTTIGLKSANFEEQEQIKVEPIVKFPAISSISQTRETKNQFIKAEELHKSSQKTYSKIANLQSDIPEERNIAEIHPSLNGCCEPVNKNLNNLQVINQTLVPSGLPALIPKSQFINKLSSNSSDVVYVPVNVNNMHNGNKIHQLQTSQINSYRPSVQITNHHLSCISPFKGQTQPKEHIYVNHNKSTNSIKTGNDDENASSIVLPLDLRLNSFNEMKNNDWNLNDTVNKPLDLSVKVKDTAKYKNTITDSSPSMSCNNCNITFSNYDLVMLHKLNECENKLRKVNELNINKSIKETENNDIKIFFQCKLCVKQPHWDVQEKKVFDTQEKYLEHLNSFHQNETLFVKQTQQIQYYPTASLVSSSLNIFPKRYYICKTCGYRGNTIRGVKQHGKIHLSNNESFDILEATTEKVKVIKNIRESENNSPLLSGKHKLITNADIENEESKKRPYFNENSICNFESLEEKSQINQTFDLNENDESDSSDSKNQNFFPPTYCTICKIQFQQERSFTAHKKFYCIESTSAVNNNNNNS